MTWVQCGPCHHLHLTIRVLVRCPSGTSCLFIYINNTLFLLLSGSVLTLLLSSSTSHPLPTMPLEPPSPSHRVHFETTCVVIPDVEESPGIHLLKRSYALPSWRRQRSDESKSDTPPPATITVRVPRSASLILVPPSLDLFITSLTHRPV